MNLCFCWTLLALLICLTDQALPKSSSLNSGNKPDVVEGSGRPLNGRIDDETVRGSGGHNPDDEDEVEGSAQPPSSKSSPGQKSQSGLFGPAKPGRTGQDSSAKTGQDSKASPGLDSPAKPAKELVTTTTSTTTTTTVVKPQFEIHPDQIDEEEDDDDDDDEDEDEDYDDEEEKIIDVGPKPVLPVPIPTQPTVVDTSTTSTTTTVTTTTTKRTYVSYPTEPTDSLFGFRFDMLQPGVLAAISGGAVVGILLTILLVMFIVYRLRKKDEGSYSCDEPHQPPHYSYAYQKAPTKEFYA